jgi:hypothetical protein
VIGMGCGHTKTITIWLCVVKANTKIFDAAFREPIIVSESTDGVPACPGVPWGLLWRNPRGRDIIRDCYTGLDESGANLAVV